MRFNIIFILYLGIYTYLPDSAKSSALWSEVVVSNSYTAENCMVQHWNLSYSYSLYQSWAQSPLKRWSVEVRWSVTQRINAYFPFKKTDLNGSTFNIEENNAFSA